MPTETKPYRRYRARGGGDESRGGMDELRDLVARKDAAADPSAPAAPRRGRAAPPRPPRPAKPPRAPARPAGRRRFWSLRGLSRGGIALRVVGLLLVAIVVWAGLGFWALSNAVGDANSRITASARKALDDPKGGLLGTPTNTLIIGSDARVGKTRAGLADTIMIMRTDPDSGRVKYLSIPRDFQVQLPGVGTSKINAAFSLGGQAGIVRAVRRLTGIPIHHLIVINFRGLPKLVDRLGGVTVNNPTALVDCKYPGGRTVSFKKGRVKLDGDRALEFARVRYCDNDFARAARQQALVAALRGKIVSPLGLPQAPWRGAAVIRALSTDLGTIDMIKMGWLQARLDQRPGDREVLFGTPALIGGVAYVVGDPDRDENQVARFEGSS
jgi:polyisoprenyl-teichoic acid--peptidoglycan teichoic acid transferase